MDVSMVALRSLYEVSQRGTMTAAAESLGYTPGAVSQHIASLSRAVGRPVVVQAGRRVKLTDAGIAVLEHARRMIESESIVQRELDQHSAPVSGALTVGAFGSSSVLLGEVVQGLRAAYPDLDVSVQELRETSSDNPFLAVSRADVDVALSLDYPDAPIERSADLDFTVLLTERFGVAGLAAADGSDPVALNELAGLDWVIPPQNSSYGLAVRAACRRAGFEPRARHLVTDTAMSLRLAAYGLGITLATPLMMRFAGPYPAHWRDLRDDVTRDLVLIVRKDEVDRTVVAVLAEALADVISRSRAGAGH